MAMKGFLINIILPVVFWGFSFPGLAQDGSPMEIYKDTRILIGKDSLDKALLILNQGLEIYPDHYDLMMLKARITAWKGDYLKSRNLIHKMEQQFSSDKELWMLLSDLYFWQNQYDSLIIICNSFLDRYEPDPEIMYKKALALFHSGYSKESIRLLEKLIRMDDDPVKAKNLLDHIYAETGKNEVLVQYLHSGFSDNRQPWNSLRIGYSRNFNRGTVLASISGGRMYDKYFQQLESEIYYNLSKKVRMLGYGNYTMNPVTLKWFYGGELFFNLPASFELSFGGQRIQYTTATFNVLNGQVSKYLGKHYITIRSNIYFNKEQKLTYSGLFRYRFYFSDKHWLRFTAGYGFLYNDPLQTDIMYQANSTGISLEYNRRVYKNNYVRLMGGIQNENPEVIQGSAMYIFSLSYLVNF
jgi:YaiO family outer membrane protein